MDRSQLFMPPPVNRIEWRIGAMNADKTKGMALAYVQARYPMDVLDAAYTHEGWQDKSRDTQDGLIVSIGVRRPDGEWVWREDGAQKDRVKNGDDNQIDTVKSVCSDAFKRAAVKVIPGLRALYDLPAVWVSIEPRGKTYMIPDHELKNLNSRYAKWAEEWARRHGLKREPTPATSVADPGPGQAPPPEEHSSLGAIPSASAPPATIPPESGSAVTLADLTRDEIEFLTTNKVGFGSAEKTLEDGTPIREATLLQAIRSKIGRAHLGWMRDKWDISLEWKGKPRKQEWIDEDEGRKERAQIALELYHRIEQREEERAPKATAVKRPAREPLGPAALKKPETAADDGLSLFLDEIRGAANECNVSVDKIREIVKEEYGKSLEDLSVEERQAVLQELKG